MNLQEPNQDIFEQGIELIWQKFRQGRLSEVLDNGPPNDGSSRFSMYDRMINATGIMEERFKAEMSELLRGSFWYYFGWDPVNNVPVIANSLSL